MLFQTLDEWHWFDRRYNDSWAMSASPIDSMLLGINNFEFKYIIYQNLVLDNKYDKLYIISFTLKLLFESELYSTFQVIYIINIVFSHQFCCDTPFSKMRF